MNNDLHIVNFIEYSSVIMLLYISLACYIDECSLHLESFPQLLSHFFRIFCYVLRAFSPTLYFLPHLITNMETKTLLSSRFCFERELLAKIIANFALQISSNVKNFLKKKKKKTHKRVEPGVKIHDHKEQVAHFSLTRGEEGREQQVLNLIHCWRV